MFVIVKFLFQGQVIKFHIKIQIAYMFSDILSIRRLFPQSIGSMFTSFTNLFMTKFLVFVKVVTFCAEEILD